MNIIHYLHNKYAYESVQMALHDTKIHYYMVFGILEYELKNTEPLA